MERVVDVGGRSGVVGWAVAMSVRLLFNSGINAL